MDGSVARTIDVTKENVGVARLQAAFVLILAAFFTLVAAGASYRYLTGQLWGQSPLVLLLAVGFAAAAIVRDVTRWRSPPVAVSVDASEVRLHLRNGRIQTVPLRLPDVTCGVELEVFPPGAVLFSKGSESHLLVRAGSKDSFRVNAEVASALRDILTRSGFHEISDSRPLRGGPPGRGSRFVPRASVRE